LSLPDVFEFPVGDGSPGQVSFNHETHVPRIEDSTRACATCHETSFSLRRHGQALAGIPSVVIALDGKGDRIDGPRSALVRGAEDGARARGPRRCVDNAGVYRVWRDALAAADTAEGFEEVVPAPALPHDALHAGLAGKFMIEKLARLPVEVDYGSEFRYRDPIVSEDTLTVVSSQSGETADTLAAQREAKQKAPRRWPSATWWVPW